MGLHDHAEALIGLFASQVTNRDGGSLPSASTIQGKPSLQQHAGVPRSQQVSCSPEQPNQCIHLLLLCKPSSLFLLLPHFSYFSLPCHCSIKISQSPVSRTQASPPSPHCLFPFTHRSMNLASQV